uniref:Uncharacterized protein n=1 Tax=Candidatus Methanophaga sp. ANME-1 ERB7 TaxID=2759913 RepID=A0A7G9ZAG2_9EURY|nr:hypothetical protein ALKFPMEL_00028 [Methanosarcinales archaeon ANME-1 ERB7]
MSHKYAQASYLSADEHVAIKVVGHKTMDRQSTSYKKKIYTVAALVVLIIVSISGCTDKPEEVQDEVNIYIYEQTGEEGDPQEQIREFYDMVDEQSGLPILVPLRKHAAEYALDPETGHVIPDTIKIYDPDGNPVDQEAALVMQDDIARDDAGNIITDAALLDIHIEQIGKNKYQINNLKQEMQVEDGIWRVKPTENPSFDKNLVDNIMKVGGGKDEITGGFVRGEDGNIYGIIIADEDVFEMYYGDFGIKARGENHPHEIDKEDCIDLGDGLYAYVYNLSETPKGSASVQSPHPFTQELSIADRENKGKYAQFRFVKETI